MARPSRSRTQDCAFPTIIQSGSATLGSFQPDPSFRSNTWVPDTIGDDEVLYVGHYTEV